LSDLAWTSAGLPTGFKMEGSLIALSIS
jgi:hypothetical protein